MVIEHPSLPPLLSIHHITDLSLTSSILIYHTTITLLSFLLSIDKLSTEDVQRIIDSISDNEAYLAFNRTPVSRIIDILRDSFDSRQPVEPFSLQLTAKFTKKLFNSFSSLYSGSYNNYIDVMMIVVMMMMAMMIIAIMIVMMMVVMMTITIMIVMMMLMMMTMVITIMVMMMSIMLMMIVLILIVIINLFHPIFYYQYLSIDHHSSSRWLLK